MKVPGIRVIAGKAKGRKLAMVPGGGVRPIGDRVKEALFSIIGPDIQGSRFLDLFAGTGSVGIEALSRGAQEAVFVDTSAPALRTVEENLSRTGLGEGAQVLRQDAFRYIERAPDAPFDYIFIAPPQYHGLWKKALEGVDKHPELLNPDAWVIVQIHPDEWEPLELQHLEEFDRRRYGKTTLIFFIYPGE